MSWFYPGYWDEYNERSYDEPAPVAKVARKKRSAWGSAERPFSKSTLNEAKRLISEGWYRTSNKYHTLARLPPGKSGIEAIAEINARYVEFGQADMPNERWPIDIQDEVKASSYYMRVYAKEPNKITVSAEVFFAFKHLGGKAA